MADRHTHPETQGLETLLRLKPELLADARVRARSMLLLLCDLVNLELGDASRPYAGTPRQQALRARARELFLSLGLGAAIGDTGEEMPVPVPEEVPEDQNAPVAAPEAILTRLPGLDELEDDEGDFPYYNEDEGEPNE